MPPPKTPTAELQRTVDVYHKVGRSQQKTAAVLGMSRGGVQARLDYAKRAGIKPSQEVETPTHVDPTTVANVLKKRKATVEELATALKVTQGAILNAVLALESKGQTISLVGDHYVFGASTSPAFMAGELPVYRSRPDGTYLFGACGDNHLGSKYSRLDVLEQLYDWYAEEKVDRVFNTGNWIDGERRFNQHDLLVHGMDAQLRYLAKHYPRRKGITTYAVAGDDHEGWYAQDLGIDIGLRA